LFPETPKGRDYLNSCGVDGRMMLKWIVKKFGMGCGLDYFG